MFQGSVMVRYFTKFTKDIFAGLVALLFIFEAFNKLAKIFKAHPLMSIKTLSSEFGILLAEKAILPKSTLGLKVISGQYS